MLATRCPEHGELADYLLGNVSEEALASISSHVESCGACESTVGQLETVADPLVAELQRPPQEVACESEPQLGRALARIHTIRPARHSGPGPLPPRVGPGAEIGSYRILEPLGCGGMGAVYKALHTRLEKTVALKVLRTERMVDAKAMARFRREMRALGQLDHPNLVTAHDGGEDRDLQYLVMEFIDGIDLSQLVGRLGPLPVSDACELARQAAAGLESAHSRGILHRDVKPANLMLASDGTVKVLDLGLARLVEQPVQNVQDEISNSGLILGTLDYMPPEQLGDSRRVDLRADIYGLGATLYKLLTGQAPFADSQYGTALQKAQAITNVPVPCVRDLRPDIPEELSSVVTRMLAKAPADRFACAGEIVEALAPFAASSELRRLLLSAEEAGLNGPDRPVITVPARSPGLNERESNPQPASRRARIRRSRMALLVTTALLLVALPVAGISMLLRDSAGGAAKSQEQAEPETAALLERYERNLIRAERAHYEERVAAHKRHLEELRETKRSLIEAGSLEKARLVDQREQMIEARLETDEAELREKRHKLLPPAKFAVEGSGFELKVLRNGAAAYANSGYQLQWKNIPEKIHGWRYTQIEGGDTPRIRLRVTREGVVYVLAQSAQLQEHGWTEHEDLGFRWNRGQTQARIFTKQVEAGEIVEIPHYGWTGTLVLVPPEGQDTTPEDGE